MVGQSDGRPYDSVCNPTFSPDGSLIAFEASIQERFFIVVGPSDASSRWKESPRYGMSVIRPVFSPDGSVSGSSGCNTYNGRYSVSGDNLTISGVSTTQLACDQPIMDQEFAYVNALQSAAFWSLEQEFTIINSGNVAVLSYIARDR